MDLKMRQEQITKAKEFIKGGQPVLPNEVRQTENKPEPEAKPKPKRGKSSDYKKYVNYWLPKELVKQVRIEAAREDDSGSQSHIVERALKQYFELKNAKDNHDH